MSERVGTVVEDSGWWWCVVCVCVGVWGVGSGEEGILTPNYPQTQAIQEIQVKS